MPKDYTNIALHYDDSSSDEEDNNESNTSKKSITQDPVPDVQELLPKKISANSLYNYYFGILIYNAPEVNEIYKAWKRTYLSGSNIPSNKVFEEWITDSTHKTISTTVFISDHPKASVKFLGYCRPYINAHLQGFAKTSLPVIRQILYSTLYGTPLPEPTKISLKALKNHFISLTHDKHTKFNSDDFKPPLRVTPENLLKTENIREWLENRYRKDLANIDSISQQVANDQFPLAGSLLTPKTQKISSSQSISKKCDIILNKYPKLLPIQKNFIAKIKLLTSPTSVDDYTQSFKDDFLKRKISILIKTEEDKGESSILAQGHIKPDADLNQSSFSPLRDYLEENFVPYDSARFKELMETCIDDADFESEFIEQLKNGIDTILEPHVYRKSLPTHHTHNILSSAHYFASLRLTNRSVIRTCKNQTSMSILGSNKEENQDFGWKFPASETYIAIERTRITKNARTALIPIQTMSNAYSDILTKIDAIKSVEFLLKEQKPERKISISDRDIAFWIRQVLQCKPLIFNRYPESKFYFPLPSKNKQDLTLFIVQLAHLLGGTEGMRYPGAVIQSQMILDLIIEGELTFADALNPKNNATFLPMTITNATPVSRMLTLTFKNLAPARYNYPGDPCSMDSIELKTFTDAEKKLTNTWCTFFSNKLKLSQDKGNLFPLLKEAIPRWFPGITV